MSPEPPRVPTDLPVEGFADPIRFAIASGSLVLTAEPGAGKSSLVPLLALEALTSGRIIVLEPRRVAARATAERLASQIGEPVGQRVGLTIRDDRRVSSQTRIEVVTEAILTSRAQRDPSLAGVSCLIFDEFHERNLHSDLGLAMALESRASLRPELSLVVMSATIDAVPIARLLGSDDPAAPVITVPGRTHPVETIYVGRAVHDPNRRSDQLADHAWVRAVASATARALAETSGSVLVFVPGRREIDLVARALVRPSRVTVRTLHGGTDTRSQHEVLGATDRQVVVATSIAETSLTLPGITAVVDGGLLRRPRFDPITGLGRLTTGWVTRFAADQRQGRAGRLGPGVCYRLWSEDDHRHLDQSTPPEVLDGDPLPLAFELSRWGDPHATWLPLLDHPGPARLDAALGLLSQLGLTDHAGRITAAGRRAGAFGTHPRNGALLVAAQALPPYLRKQIYAAVALLDSDRWPDSTDFESEVSQQVPHLGRAIARLERSSPAPESEPHDSATLGQALAAAWPDRIAMVRPGRAGRFLSATGQEAQLSDGPLSRAEFLVVVQADAGGGGQLTIRRAVPLDRSDVLRMAASSVTWQDHVEWDDRSGALRAERRQCLGAIVLHSANQPDPEPEAVATALRDGLRKRGLEVLPWKDADRQLRHRLAWLHAVDPSWPDPSDLHLLDNLDTWLDLSRCRRPADLGRLNLSAALLQLLTWQQRSTLDQLAPVHLAQPDGRSAPIEYDSGRPIWRVRLQRLLGLDHHPTIGPRDQPLTIELLSPANRPVQVTTDLPGFWRGSYAHVRSDLRGRYPKHPWPERPWERRPDD